jgi:hypothetical protein
MSGHGPKIIGLTLRSGSGGTPVSFTLSVEDAPSLPDRLNSVLAKELPSPPANNPLGKRIVVER